MNDNKHVSVELRTTTKIKVHEATMQAQGIPAKYLLDMRL
jgi:hypothetical protein